MTDSNGTIITLKDVSLKEAMEHCASQTDCTGVQSRECGEGNQNLYKFCNSLGTWYNPFCSDQTSGCWCVWKVRELDWESSRQHERKARSEHKKRPLAECKNCPSEWKRHENNKCVRGGYMKDSYGKTITLKDVSLK